MLIQCFKKKINQIAKRSVNWRKPKHKSVAWSKLYKLSFCPVPSVPILSTLLLPRWLLESLFEHTCEHMNLTVLRAPAYSWHSCAYRMAFCKKIEVVLKVAFKLSITSTRVSLVPAAKLSSDQRNIITLV